MLVDIDNSDKRLRETLRETFAPDNSWWLKCEFKGRRKCGMFKTGEILRVTWHVKVSASGVGKRRHIWVYYYCCHSKL
jgi:hypothetical protein